MTGYRVSSGLNRWAFLQQEDEHCKTNTTKSFLSISEMSAMIKNVWPVLYSGQLASYLASDVQCRTVVSKLSGQCCTVLYSGQLASYLVSAVQWSASNLSGQCRTVVT